MTRLLYVQPSSAFGGAERQAATIIPLLAARGVAVTALVGPGRTIGKWLARAGVDDVVFSRDLPPDWADTHGLARLAYPLRFPGWEAAAARAVADTLARRPIDVVFAAMPSGWIAATGAARAARVPVVWRVGGMEISLAERVLLRAWARRHAPDALVCNADSVRRLFAPLVRAPAVVIPNGVDVTAFARRDDAGHRFRPAWARVVVGFAGRLVPQKRAQDFVACAVRVARADAAVAFLIAGQGKDRAQLQREVDALGLGDRVRFCDYVDDVAAFYSACDVFVLPSRSEGCPNALLEAMAARCAIVASDAPAIREVVREGRDGLLYRVGDLEALTMNVSRLVQDDELRARLSGAAHRRVRNAFSADRSAAALGRVLDAVVARRRAAHAA